MSSRPERFHELHRSGTFVMPNPWDVGSARFLEAMGFPALATTSSGHAATLGREDQHVTLNEAIDHVGEICAAVDVPVNVDLEWGFASAPEGLAAVIDRIAEAGAAGFSLEDFDPVAGAIVPTDVAATRVAAGAEAANRHGLVLTARAENHLYGVTDLDDTIDRLERFVAAGAHVVYAPGVTQPDDVARTVTIGAPVNVLAFPGAPTVPELSALGVRRISTGGALARVAYTAARRAADELLAEGTYGYLQKM
ncbi:MAG: isocitrate lyase/PEP mutase family protein [Ilumatobacteraceae bacterium]